MSSRWGDEKTIHFIRLYRDYECLWNLSSPLYTNKSARDIAYSKIQEDMSEHNVCMTVKDIKNKIKGLRSTYHQELHKINKANSSTLACEPYKPTLVWFNEIDFLNDAIQYRKSKSTEVSQTSETLEQPQLTYQTSFKTALKQPKKKRTQKTRTSIEANSEEVEQPQSPVQASIEIKMEPLEQGRATDTCIEMNIEPVNQPETSQPSFEANIEVAQSEMLTQTNKRHEKPHKKQNSNKRRLVIIRKTFQNKHVNSTNEARNEITPQLDIAPTGMNPTSNEKMKDEFYYFGQSVAAQLRKLPINNALDMQTNIQMLLSTERSRLYHSTSYEGSTPYSHSEDSSTITPYPPHYHMVSPSHYPDISSDQLNSAVVFETIPKSEPIADEVPIIE